jgi:hypothetical protein
MEAGDYLLIGGISVMIKRVNDRFVVLDSGQQIPRAQAEGFKCSSSRPEDCPTYINQRRGGKTFISKQLGLF